MTVRSDQVYAGVPPAGAYTDLFVVPAGYRFIIRSAIMHDVTSGGHVALLYMRPVSGGALVSLKRVAATASNTAYTFDTWTVLEPGNVLQVYTDSASLHVIVSGALLAL